MSMLLFYALTGAGAFALCVAIMPAVMAAARRWDLLDHPDPRKIHREPVPRVGGLAIAGAALTAAGAAVLVNHLWIAEGNGPLLPREMVTLLAVGAFMFAVGLVDDVRSIPAKFKLLALVAGGAALAGAGIGFEALYAQHGLYVALGLFAWPATILWVAGITTAVNFIDGLDGLAGGLGALAAGLLAVMLMAAGEPAAAAVALALTGALMGFLLFNRHPAKVFMGDGGSIFIGFMLAACCLLAAPRIGTMKAMIIPAAALSVPIVDTALTIVRRRFIQRRSIFSAERGHIHHRLLELGLTQRQAVMAIYGVSVVAVGVAWMATWAENWASFGVLSLMVPLLLGFFRASGSIRSRDILDAVRHKRQVDRELSQDQRLFEEMQLCFRQARTFDQWWEMVCRTAAALRFAHVKLPAGRRDGAERTLVWRPEDGVDASAEVLSATVPIRQRRHDAEPLRAAVDVLAEGSLERAGHRLAMFSRLMNEHSVADIPDAEAGPAAAHGQGPEHTGVLGRLGALNQIAAPPPPRRAWAREPAAETAGSVVQGLRVAIVHDFLYTYAGAERVLEQMVGMYPHADLFSLFDFLDDDQRQFIANKPVRTTFLQYLPFARSRHRAYLPLMPLAIEQLDVSGYDLVLSSSYLAAKGIITGPDQLHVCYCHSPARMAWDLQHQYLRHSGIGFGPRGMIARSILHYIRNWDSRSALGVDTFVANSSFVARRIQKLYRRPATVIYPPVDTAAFTCEADKQPYYVTASRLVPYKRIDLIVEAFSRMPGRKLRVVGDGPEAARIASLAGPNVELLGYQSAERLKACLQGARGFLFAAEEDFGIAPVEAMACGTPVIAYGRGGATESVVENETGLFFNTQTPESVVDAVERFEAHDGGWDAAAVRQGAERFSAATFRTDLAGVIEDRWLEFAASRAGRRPDEERAEQKPAAAGPPSNGSAAKPSIAAG